MAAPPRTDLNLHRARKPWLLEECAWKQDPEVRCPDWLYIEGLPTKPAAKAAQKGTHPALTKQGLLMEGISERDP
jgi:hypothetical protein